MTSTATISPRRADAAGRTSADSSLFSPSIGSEQPSSPHAIEWSAATAAAVRSLLIADLMPSLVTVQGQSMVLEAQDVKSCVGSQPQTSVGHFGGSPVPWKSQPS